MKKEFTDAELKNNSKDIENWINLIINRNLTNLDEIKKVLADNKYRNTNDGRFAKIVATVIQAKTKGDKIILKDGMFSKNLRIYIPAADVSVKCLTNDHLFLHMLCTKIFDADKDMTDEFKEALMDSTIASVTYASENFILNADTSTGLIQDYDSTFSAVCSDDFRQSDKLNEVIDNKENVGYFNLYDTDYRYFGNSDLCVIGDPKMSNKDIYDRIQNMTYLRTDKNKFREGERLIRKDDKLKYMYQQIAPENFCPAFWFAPSEVKCNFLFEFSMDYNDVFNMLYNPSTKEIVIPADLCYWDTLNQFFDFIGVYSIASLDLTNQARRDLMEWTKDYYGFYAPALVKVKKIYMGIERLFKDFLNSFLNNSSYDRYLFMLKKIETLLKDEKTYREDLKEKWTEAISFITGLKFTRMIQNQFKQNVLGILKELQSAVRNYVKGSNPQNIMAEIRGVAGKIYKLLPSDTMDDACFPFICPLGPLFGNQIVVNNPQSDVILSKVTKQVEKKVKETKKKKTKVAKELEIIGKTSARYKAYISKYFNARPKNKKAIDPMDANQIANFITTFLINFASETQAKPILARAIETEDQDKIKYKEEPLFEIFIKDFAAAKKATPQKKATVSPGFAQAMRRYGVSFNIVPDNESDSESESESEGKLSTKNQTITPQSPKKTSISQKTKKKKNKGKSKKKKLIKANKMDISSDEGSSSSDDDGQTPGQ
ncbi:MAG: hypothetical protein J6Y28_07380 [Acholeplasmatales bacterium]|nr:hypothetical protein [Methanobrevibacter sp.]MBP5445976.1 hypothetical protein [Acholeplasmatales bacterium]